MIGAGEDRGVTFVIAAHLHPAMPARVEKRMHLAGAVAAQDHRLFTHSRHEEVTGVGYLALMADKQPRAGENALLLLGINLVADEDLAADQPRRRIDETGAIST